MSKITTEHLARGAYVYIRQSTADQLTHNQESRRRQYGLVDRARQLGWTTVEVIDDDLGRSGGGIVRPGFERLLAAICEARVGAVLAVPLTMAVRLVLSMSTQTLWLVEWLSGPVLDPNEIEVAVTPDTKPII